MENKKLINFKILLTNGQCISRPTVCESEKTILEHMTEIVKINDQVVKCYYVSEDGEYILQITNISTLLGELK